MVGSQPPKNDFFLSLFDGGVSLFSSLHQLNDKSKAKATDLGIVISGLGPGQESQTTPRTSSLPRVAS